VQATRIPGTSEGRGESWGGAKKAALISLAISLLLMLGIFTARADAALLSGYCQQPTGDYCTSVSRSQAGKIILGFNTFSFSGRYTLCVRLVRLNNIQCRKFPLHPRGGVYVSRVNFRQKFLPAGRGRWCASWHKGGFKLGPSLCWQYTGRIVHAG
jgi:hypothetical protein